MLWDWFWGILGVLVVSSKREVYTATLSKDSPVVGWGGLPGYGALSQKRQSSVYSPYTITNLEKS